VSCDAPSVPARVRAFARICEEHNLHGLLFQHLAICRRRAWLHMHRIDYAHLEERMAMGSLSHALNKVRDTSVLGLLGLSPDRIEWKDRRVIEAKGRRGAWQAVSRQTMFYALMLHNRTGQPWTPAIEIISERRIETLEMTEKHVIDMLAMAEALSRLKDARCPNGINAPICGTCSYRFFCGKE